MLTRLLAALPPPPETAPPQVPSSPGTYFNKWATDLQDTEDPTETNLLLLTEKLNDPLDLFPRVLLRSPTPESRVGWVRLRKA